MTNAKDIDSVNHVGHMVHDLDEAVSAYERFGFSFTPLSMHKGSLTPGEPEVPLGSGNRCAIFERNYLEVLAHVRQDLPGIGIPERLARFQGLHIICFGCGDASVADERIKRQGIATSGVTALQRDVDTEEGIRTAKFARVVFDEDHMPEGIVQAAVHFTPQYIHQARYMHHENGAMALSEVVVCVQELAAYVEKYRKIIGQPGERRGATHVFQLQAGRVVIVAATELDEILPGETAPALPAMVAWGVACQSLETARALLGRREISIVENNGGFFIPASAAYGCAVIFEEEVPGVRGQVPEK